MGEKYKATVNTDTGRENYGEVLKDNVSTGVKYKGRKGIFSDTSGEEQAKEEAARLNAIENRKESGKAYVKNMQEGRMDNMGNSYKKGGKITASTRADGCCQRGKTKGRMV
jgi:hypothetical protein